MHEIASTMRSLSPKKLPPFIKTKAGVAGLAAIIMAPAGAIALQVQDDGGSSLNQHSSLEALTQTNENKSQGSSSGATAGQANNDDSPQTSVTINGESIPAGPDGSVHKTVQSGDSTTSVDITTNNSSSATDGNTSRTRTSTNVNVKSTSRSHVSSTDGGR